jgi:pimeloyl-ACP methyl ester carboxylesterase
VTEARNGTFDRAGATLAYDVRDGCGPTVVALHGLGSSRAGEDVSGYADWSPIYDAGRRTVRYDARGHGRSTGRALPEDYTWSRLADDLLALLDHLAPAEPVDAVGVSMGVGTLLHAVTRRPDRFRRLALVLPPTAWATRAAQADNYRQMAKLLDAQGPDALAAAAASAPTLPLIAAGGWTIPPPDVDEHLLSAVLRGAADADLPDPEAVAAIRQPVLLLPWTDDPGHPVQTAEQLHDLLPNSTLKLTQTVEDVRAIGATVAAFFGPSGA